MSQSVVVACRSEGFWLVLLLGSVLSFLFGFVVCFGWMPMFLVRYHLDLQDSRVMFYTGKRIPYVVQRLHYGSYYSP